MQRGSSLLLGNGINNLSNTYSWKDLIRGLVESCNGKVAEGSKPFPLLYEEIVSRCFARNEKQLISSICEDTKRLRRNSWHINVLETGIERILTTNYDYLLETSAQESKGLAQSFKSSTREQRYSLFRKITLRGVEMWHIHGEADHPSSLCLGYEHYAGYIESMRAFLTKLSERNANQTLRSRILSPDAILVDSWVNDFFTNDIHILGLGLDYTEIDLWWLLTYRTRMLNDKSMPIANRISLYEWESRLSANRDRNQLLESLGVEIKQITAPNWRQFYSGAIDMIIKSERKKQQRRTRKPKA
jgi:hypothetical protein